jgi:hypothetical protein
MTIEVHAVLDDKKRIEILDGDKPKLAPMKAAHKPGEVIRVIFSDEYESENAMASRKFHAMRDEYADGQGLDKEYAKALLKYRHGVTLPYMEGFKPPIGPRGAFLEVEVAGETRLFWMKSTTVYTTAEWVTLIMGTEKDLAEA